MIIKAIVDEDFSNYNKPSMLIGFPRCSWKCEKECGMRVCQNGVLATAKNIEVSVDEIINRYLNNKLTTAVVCGGLEPMDSWEDLMLFIKRFREKSQDTVVVYTGYYKEEITDKIDILKRCPNIIVKFGRYLPGHEKHYDDTLGVWLASDNQHAERIS